MKTIGTAEIVPGERINGYLAVGSETDGTPIHLPILIASGNEKGPTVWIIGCVHGDEYGGAASIIQYFIELDIQRLKGTIIGLPVANPPSFKAWSRISPLDGANLNRVFPGDPNGTFSLRLAHILLEKVTETADYVLDLHSGGLALHVPYFVICKDGTSEVDNRSLWLAKRMGTEIIWQADEQDATPGTGTDYYVKHGIPSVTVEVGGGTVTKDQEVQFKQAIDNALKALDMLPGEAPVQESYKIYKKAEFIFSGEGGLFVPSCEVGATLKKGELLGSIIDLYGKVQEEIHSPFDQGFVAALGNLYWPTEPGRLIAEVYSV